MSEEKYDGGSAYPVMMIPLDGDGGYTEVLSRGMSLRDYFAGMALQGLITSNPPNIRWELAEAHDARTVEAVLSIAAYDYADAMITEGKRHDAR